ncbi:hypothetical protein E0K89_001355 [Aquicoccus sp. SCR17]|nr:hypothetical protein [Carideicomes alvinocaridis]
MLRLMVIFAILAAPVLADVKGSDGRVVDCYCTDRDGSRMELGEFTCLRVDGRVFTAQCQMSLNVPMWREIRAGCTAETLPQG